MGKNTRERREGGKDTKGIKKMKKVSEGLIYGRNHSP
jgi:hypothetical protein